jgi:hypothetical protein
MHSPSHIGAFVSEIVDGHDFNVSLALRVLGVTRQTLSILINEHGGLAPDICHAAPNHVNPTNYRRSATQSPMLSQTSFSVRLRARKLRL